MILLRWSARFLMSAITFLEYPQGVLSQPRILLKLFGISVKCANALESDLFEDLTGEDRFGDQCAN